ncbi:hypothetical protein DICVIV_07317 [Dictyocaulus viviparus]|uniref:Uncharacterized protein n=1 Tax=Dictyocaulus viviparus TaxID=29172 RepID=A0A0D8XS78_DICVI|nr:hypothetical protein DICVIV_07317 [Dictyocaulus viviparus]
MEVDLDSSPNAVDSQGSQTSSASASSLAVQFSAEDVQENNDSNFPKSAESEMIDGKTRRLNRRLALAKLQLPTLAMKSDIIIDLTADENKEDDVEWLKKKFPFIEADHAKATKPLKKLLEKKLAEKRMAGLVKRKELYMKDNEDIFNGEEDDEVEEFSRSRGDFKPEEVKDNEEDEDYSGDDEDEEESNECVPKNSLEPESENNITNSHSFPVLENSLDSAPVIVNAAEHNCDAKDDDYDSNIGMTQPVFPSSLSQWFDDGFVFVLFYVNDMCNYALFRSTQESTELIRPTARVPEFVNIGTFSDMDPFKNDNEDDILMFCSGQFDNQDFPRPVDDRAENDAELSDTHCDVIEVKSTQKRKRLVESDEEDSDTVAGSHEIPEQLHRDMDSLTNILNDEPKAEVTALRRTLIPESDSDSEVSIESIGEDSLSGKQSSEEEEDEAAEEKVNNSECGDEENSDDEVAVVRRLERNNSEWKENRSKWFDDEASLSGDDVGSDQDEDIDIPNEYEPEEGDADIVPDSEILRRQNHRLLMKQESDRDHQELVKLQERLLVDGELDSTETDRTFRLKLRTDVDVQEVVNEEEDTLNDEKDVKQDYEKANDGEDENDLIAVAANSLPVANYVSDDLCRAPRSLLGQSNLKNAIKEIPGPSILARQATVGSKVVPVKLDKSVIEEDAEKLANYVCINYFIQGDEPGPKIKPNSEYPAWIFELDLRPPRPLEDMDPEKDGWLYWRALRIRQIEQNRRIQKLKTRFLHLQNSPSMKKYRRF